MTIANLCRNYPESKAHAFTLASSPQTIYFAIGEVETLRIAGVASQVKTLRLDLQTGFLVVTTLTIKILDVISPMTLGEYYHEAMSCYNGLRLKNSIKPKNSEIQKQIKKFEENGFKRRKR